MSHFSKQRMVWLCILAGISSSLYAIDGVVLIDQSRALSGNPSSIVGNTIVSNEGGGIETDGPGWPTTRHVHDYFVLPAVLPDVPLCMRGTSGRNRRLHGGRSRVTWATGLSEITIP